MTFDISPQMWKTNAKRITNLDGDFIHTQNDNGLVMSSYRLGTWRNKIFRDVIDDVYEIWRNFFQFLRRYLLNFKSKFILRSRGNIKFNNESRYRSLDENNLIKSPNILWSDQWKSVNRNFVFENGWALLVKSLWNLLESLSNDVQDKFCRMKFHSCLTF